MSARHLLLATAALGVGLAGCASTPGTGFATLAGAQVSGGQVLAGGRLDAAGRWKTNNGYAVALDGGKLAVELAQVALQAPGQAAAGGGAASIVIDPANPPAGYTFCHNTDCHKADGTVKTFDEIRAELAGGGAATPPKTVATLKPAVARLELPLTAPAPGGWSLGGCEPHCFLPQGSLSQAVLGLGRVVATGAVVPAAGGEPRPFTLDLPVPGSAFPAKVAAEVTATGPRALGLAGTFTLTDKLFDGLPWERLLATPGPVDLDADAQAAEVLATNLAKSTWNALLEPSSPR